MSRWSYYLPILEYHRIGTAPAPNVPTVSPEAFERHLSTIAQARYRVLGLEEIAGLLDRRQPLPRRSTAITFDDGYEETFTVAWPLLKRFGFSAATFVTVGEVGRPGFTTWEQVIAMAREGMTIGCHTMHHGYLPSVPAEQLEEELVESKRLLEARIGKPVHFLSYPIGGFTPEAQLVAKSAGYRAAFTTNRGLSRHVVDRFAIRRVKVTDRDANPWLFRAKLSGYYDAFRRLRHPA